MRAGRRFLFAALLGAALAPASAGAHTADADAGLPRVLGPRAEPAAGDLYRVPVADGPALLTHGPDPELATEPATRLLGSAPERPPVCASSDDQHVLYGRISGDPNQLGAYAASIRSTVRQANAVLNRESLASGGPTADYRVLCDDLGQIRIDAFTASSSSFGTVVNAARAAGFEDSDRDYTVFFDSSGGGACGIGSYHGDERLTADNASNSGGDYAVVYRGCWGPETMMHENGHNQGAVQYGAPYSTGTGGHCWDEEDVMCYSPDGGNLHQSGTISRCPDLAFDCGYDTYFDSAPEPGEYLATHWNIGSPLNSFIDFGAGGPVDPPDPPDPGADDPIALTDGVAIGARSAITGGWRYFRIRVPRGQRALRVSLSGPACAGAPCDPDLDLYVRRGAEPTLAEKVCAPQLDGSSERCVVRRPARGRWFVGVRSYRATTSTPFSVKAKIVSR